jgi:glycosyltransferase involved in cell wall biosynthesis
MAYGVPVAASRIESVLEVCGDAVLYFDPDSSQEMADVMVRLLEDNGLRNDLGVRGQLRAQRFSWIETARRTLEVLRAAASM